MRCGECMYLICVRERRLSRARRVVAGRCFLAVIRSADCKALHEPREECSIGEVNKLVIWKLLTPRPAR